LVVVSVRVFMEVELMMNELGYLADENSKQSIEQKA
jgi:hypothetical protein